MTRNFWHYLDTFPPILIRLLARDRYKRQPLGAEEIVARSGLSWVEVERLSWATSWKDVDVLSMRKFLTACNVDFCNRAQAHRIDSYLRSSPTWKYLRGSSQWLSLYQPMIVKWKDQCHGPRH
jgi:hypothetical protein